MRIVRVTAWRQWQPFADGPYTCSGGRVAEGFDAVIVRLTADDGTDGFGEFAPLGSFYSDAFAAGARAGIAELAPAVLGHDPRQTTALMLHMDRMLRGHPYVKSAIDMAAFDLAAKAAGLPLAEYLGGRFGESVPLYRSVPIAPPADAATGAKRYVESGYRRLQVKVGEDPLVDAERVHAVRDAVGPGVVLFADANGGWPVRDALRFVQAMRGVDLHLEQPCLAYEDCLTVRAKCDCPMVLDESVVMARDLARIVADRAADAVTLKISRVGGIERTRRLRDFAVDMDLGVTIEDTGGADIDTAATVHLMLSTPEQSRLHTVDFMNWVTVSNGTGMPPAGDGVLGAPLAPGLGLAVDPGAFGAPLCEHTA